MLPSVKPSPLAHVPSLQAKPQTPSCAPFFIEWWIPTQSKWGEGVKHNQNRKELHHGLASYRNVFILLSTLWGNFYGLGVREMLDRRLKNVTCSQFIVIVILYWHSVCQLGL